MFLTMLIICGIFKVSSCHSIHHDHFKQYRPEDNFGFPFESEIDSFGTQTGLQRRHIQDTSYVNLHTAVHRHGHYGSGESRVPDFYNYKMEDEPPLIKSYGFSNHERGHKIVTNSILNVFVPPNRRYYAKTEASHRSWAFDHKFEQGKGINVKEEPLNNVGVVSLGLHNTFGDQELVDSKTTRKFILTQPIEYTTDYDQLGIKRSQDTKTVSTTTEETVQQKNSPPLSYTTTKITDVIDVSGDRWIWSASNDQVKKVPTSTSATEPEVDNRDAFDGKCATGYVRVLGQCVMEDK